MARLIDALARALVEDYLREQTAFCTAANDSAENPVLPATDAAA